MGGSSTAKWWRAGWLPHAGTGLQGALLQCTRNQSKHIIICSSVNTVRCLTSRQAARLARLRGHADGLVAARQRASPVRVGGALSRQRVQERGHLRPRGAQRAPVRGHVDERAAALQQRTADGLQVGLRACNGLQTALVQLNAQTRSCAVGGVRCRSASGCKSALQHAVRMASRVALQHRSTLQQLMEHDTKIQSRASRRAQCRNAAALQARQEHMPGALLHLTSASKA